MSRSLSFMCAFSSSSRVPEVATTAVSMSLGATRFRPAEDGFRRRAFAEPLDDVLEPPAESARSSMTGAAVGGVREPLRDLLPPVAPPDAAAAPAGFERRGEVTFDCGEEDDVAVDVSGICR